jgi:MGT family glycosyltransferase
MKVLAYTSPARGHLFPLMPILDELSSRGHEISVRTLASQVSMLRERGFEAKPISAAVEAIEHDDYLGKTPPARVKRAMKTFTRRAPHDGADLDSAMAEESPDALLVDCMSWGAAAAAERWGGPWAQWFPYPLPVSSRDVPPFGLGLAPATGPASRFRDRVLRPLLTGTMERASLPDLNATRDKLGVRPLEGADDLFLAAPLLLYMTAEPLEYPRSDWPESVQMVGPCAWDPPADPPAWLAGIDKPIVLVSTSSEFQDDGKLVTTALDALATEDVQVIATLPSSDVPASVPANARVEPFVPHAPILERAACAITHGGAGVTMKALAAGVPVCIVPFGRDQPEVARRVELASAGTQVSPSKLSAGRLRDAVHEAMSMKEGAARVAAGFRATGGAAAGADAFEALAADRKRAPIVSS